MPTSDQRAAWREIMFKHQRASPWSKNAQAMSLKWILYRLVMRVAHRFNWHYAPPCYPDGDTMLWCQWCGLRQVVKRRGGGE